MTQTIHSEYRPPTQEELDRIRQSWLNLPKLSEEETQFKTKIKSELNSEYKRLSHELKILLELIGDPNDFANYLEKMVY